MSAEQEIKEQQSQIIKSGKTQGIWKFCQNTGNLVCSRCKFPDSKGNRYFKICRNFFLFFSFFSLISLLSQYCVCNSHVNWHRENHVNWHRENHVNWHRENLLSDRENTGNLKIQFEWVP